MFRFCIIVLFLNAVLVVPFACGAQPPASPADPSHILDKAYPAVAMVLAGRPGTEQPVLTAAALVVREYGILLTSWFALRDARTVQVRLGSGDIFDNVQLLGVDARRGVAAIRINASRLPSLPTAPLSEVKAGEPVAVLSHGGGLPWSASTGIFTGVRLADDVPGAGSGYRLLQVTAPMSPGSIGGVVIDARGRALALIVSSASGQNGSFAVPVDSVIGLADSMATKDFGNGSALNPPGDTARPRPEPVVAKSARPQGATPDAPEKSAILADSKDREEILRDFKTMFVDARQAQFFKSDQMKAALGRNKGFEALRIRVVDDPKLADTVLVVSYTFAWDYPFQLKHQNTTTVLLAGKGSGPISGPLGAASVASEFVKVLKPYRAAPPAKPK